MKGEIIVMLLFLCAFAAIQIFDASSREEILEAGLKASVSQNFLK